MSSDFLWRKVDDRLRALGGTGEDARGAGYQRDVARRQADVDVAECQDTDAARELLRRAPGIEVLDERKPGGYPTAATEAANRDTVYVGRIREDLSHERGLNLWIVSDNIRKGAATNSVQIAEILVREHI